MNKNVEVITVWWEGPCDIASAYECNESDKDYGVYQVYGNHPVYGSGTLVYIGMADKQTFGRRLSQEDWDLWDCGDHSFTVRLGRLCGETPSDDAWSKQIADVEALLILANWPAANSRGIIDSDRPGLDNLLVLNKGDYGLLLPEVAGERYHPTVSSVSGSGCYHVGVYEATCKDLPLQK